ncbi:hypothetical protein KI387_017752 [Taxus chinensis]|uniref:Uncharacterized protein n=1 Tax=Taxus chinensis TaxID=29808 RepID=A0AA38GK31_TAXCH|nr:hypothetical protein KI387_017752 [Taxus chinensis]
MERLKTWITAVVLCVAMAITMKKNMVGLFGMWRSEAKTFPHDLDNRLQTSQVRFAGEFMGPESLAFDREGRGPYTGVSDGRILRWEGPRHGWIHFAHTSPHRKEVDLGFVEYLFSGVKIS